MTILNELSAHADQNDLLNYEKHIKGLSNIFLVHTEMPQAAAFKEAVENDNPLISVEIPNMGQEFLI